MPPGTCAQEAPCGHSVGSARCQANAPHETVGRFALLCSNLIVDRVVHQLVVRGALTRLSRSRACCIQVELAQHLWHTLLLVSGHTPAAPFACGVARGGCRPSRWLSQEIGLPWSGPTTMVPTPLIGTEGQDSSLRCGRQSLLTRRTS
jgi:hypothetical protein